MKNKKAIYIVSFIALAAIAYGLHSSSKKRAVLNANNDVNDIYAYLLSHAKKNQASEITNNEEQIKAALLTLPKDILKSLKAQTIIIKQYNDMGITLATPTFMDQQSFDLYKSYAGLIKKNLEDAKLNDLYNKINI